MGTLKLFSVAIVLSLSWCASAEAAMYYHPVDPLPGHFQTFGLAVNNAGTAVGYGRFGTGLAVNDRAFRWTPTGGTETLTDLAGTTNMNRAMALSDSGLIVGVKFGNTVFRAATWNSTDKMQQIITEGPQFSWAYGISFDGTVMAGDGRDPQAGTRYSGGIAQSIPLLPGKGYGIAFDISDDGNVVVGTNEAFTAYRWSSATGAQPLGTLPGQTRAVALATNGDGSVVVGQGGPSSSLSAWRWKAGVMTNLGDLPGGGTNSIAKGVSADGNIVVGESTTARGSEAFIWDEAHGMRRLYDLIENQAIDVKFRLLSADGISPDGTRITGNALNYTTGLSEAFVISPDFTSIPEPASLSLGLMAFWMLGRSRGSARATRV